MERKTLCPWRQLFASSPAAPGAGASWWRMPILCRGLFATRGGHIQMKCAWGEKTQSLWFSSTSPCVIDQLLCGPQPQPQNSLVRISVCNQVSSGNSYLREPGRSQKQSPCSLEDTAPLTTEKQFSLVVRICFPALTLQSLLLSKDRPKTARISLSAVEKRTMPTSLGVNFGREFGVGGGLKPWEIQGRKKIAIEIRYRNPLRHSPAIFLKFAGPN